jgi:SAM-dependent methyltransferase
MADKQDMGAKYPYGVPLDSSLARRERLADRYDIDFGQDRIFPELIDGLLREVDEGVSLLEVGAATGLLTRPLLEKAGTVTALEPSEGMLRRLLASDVASSPTLHIKQGMVEDLLHDEIYDTAVVTFTPRRGMGLLRLLVELAHRVQRKVVVLLDIDGSMDWAYLARGGAIQGLDVSLRFVTASEPDVAPEQRRRAVILVACVEDWEPVLEPVTDWTSDAREIDVPYPPPRGTATRLVRYFLAAGDRAILITTDPRGVDRLYGNLRTAVHRLGRDEVTVRRQGDSIQIVRLPKSTDEAEPLG